ncbi:nucleotidyltransferase domain-containing protein [Patescibacteria group bacterium]|nr:nucleotidyltransferase domain-containing protein [Patescibacteria group bacterium]
MEVEECVQRTAQIVARELGSEYRVVLFGSHARGDAVPRSDIDIGIYGPEPVPQRARERIAEALDRLPTLRTIDVVDLATLGTEYRESILAYAHEVA